MSNNKRAVRKPQSEQQSRVHWELILTSPLTKAVKPHFLKQSPPSSRLTDSTHMRLSSGIGSTPLQVTNHLRCTCLSIEKVGLGSQKLSRQSLTSSHDPVQSTSY